MIMARRRKSSRSLFSPLADNFIKRLSSTDVRFRQKVVRYCFWGLSLLFLYSLMSGTYGIPRIVRLELERKALRESNRRQEAALIDAVRVKKMLLSDPYYIEYIARTRYHMVYPNEIMYVYRYR
jgi:cell division protein FtsB